MASGFWWLSSKGRAVSPHLARNSKIKGLMKEGSGRKLKSKAAEARNDLPLSQRAKSEPFQKAIKTGLYENRLPSSTQTGLRA